MAVGLFVVRAPIARDREAAFNEWYNEEHLPRSCGTTARSAAGATAGSRARTSTAIWRSTRGNFAQVGYRHSRSWVLHHLL